MSFLSKLKNKKKGIALFLVLQVLVVVHFVAPRFLLEKIRKFLATFSPLYVVDIQGLRIYPWKFCYGFKKLTLALKEENLIFLEIDDIDVRLDWTEFFKAHLRSDIRITGAQLTYSDFVRQKIFQKSNESAEQAKEAGDTLFPFSVEKLEIFSSTITSSDFFGVADQLPVMIENLNAEFTNLTPTVSRQISPFSINGLINKTAPATLFGHFNNFYESFDWEAKFIAKEFLLATSNPWLMKAVPVSFKYGFLNLYSEAHCSSGTIKGYAKPFAKEVELMIDDNDFQGLKQFGIEMTLATLNQLFQNSDKQTVAAVLEFSYEDGKFQWDFWKVLAGLLKNGYVAPLTEGLESTLAVKPSES